MKAFIIMAVGLAMLAVISGMLGLGVAFKKRYVVLLDQPMLDLQKKSAMKLV